MAIFNYQTPQDYNNGMGAKPMPEWYKDHTKRFLSSLAGFKYDPSTGEVGENRFGKVMGDINPTYDFASASAFDQLSKGSMVDESQAIKDRYNRSMNYYKFATAAAPAVVGVATGNPAAVATGVNNVGNMIDNNNIEQQNNPMDYNPNSGLVQEYAKRGKKLKGKSHEEGGVHVVAEGGERIFSKKSTSYMEHLAKKGKHKQLGKYVEDEIEKQDAKETDNDYMGGGGKVNKINSEIYTSYLRNYLTSQKELNRESASIGLTIRMFTPQERHNIAKAIQNGLYNDASEIIDSAYNRVNEIRSYKTEPSNRNNVNIDNVIKLTKLTSRDLPRSYESNPYDQLSLLKDNEKYREGKKEELEATNKFIGQQINYSDNNSELKYKKDTEAYYAQHPSERPGYISQVTQNNGLDINSSPVFGNTISSANPQSSLLNYPVDNQQTGLSPFLNSVLTNTKGVQDFYKNTPLPNGMGVLSSSANPQNPIYNRLGIQPPNNYEYNSVMANQPPQQNIQPQTSYNGLSPYTGAMLGVNPMPSSTGVEKTYTIPKDDPSLNSGDAYYANKTQTPVIVPQEVYKDDFVSPTLEKDIAQAQMGYSTTTTPHDSYLPYVTDAARGLVGLGLATKKLPKYEQNPEYLSALGRMKTMSFQGLSPESKALIEQQNANTLNAQLHNVVNASGGNAGAVLGNTQSAFANQRLANLRLGAADSEARRQNLLTYNNAVGNDTRFQKGIFDQYTYNPAAQAKEAGAQLAAMSIQDAIDRHQYDKGYGVNSQQQKYMDYLMKTGAQYDEYGNLIRTPFKFGDPTITNTNTISK